jgi:hypothetical protein
MKRFHENIVTVEKRQVSHICVCLKVRAYEFMRAWVWLHGRWRVIERV